MHWILIAVYSIWQLCWIWVPFFLSFFGFFFYRFSYLINMMRQAIIWFVNQVAKAPDGNGGVYSGNSYLGYISILIANAYCLDYQLPFLYFHFGLSTWLHLIVNLLISFEIFKTIGRYGHERCEICGCLWSWQCFGEFVGLCMCACVWNFLQHPFIFYIQHWSLESRFVLQIQASWDSSLIKA